MQDSLSKILSLYLSSLNPVGSLKNYHHFPDLQKFKKNEVIFREGDEAECLFLLYRGKVMMVKKSGDNFYSTVENLKAGEMLGLPAVMSGVPYHTSAIALRRVSSFIVSKDELLQFLIDHPHFHLSIAKRLSKKVLYYQGILSKRK